MARIVKFCKNCGWADLTDASVCPDCGNGLETTQYGEVYWNKCTPEKKKVVAESLMGEIVQKREAEQFDQQRENILIMTTPTVEGRKVKAYLGLVSGIATYNTGGVFGDGYTDSGQRKHFNESVKIAERQMRLNAKIDTDAIVGVQISISAASAVNMMIVTLTGTMVQLEPEE